MKAWIIFNALTLAATVIAGKGPSLEEARKTSPWIVAKAGLEEQDGRICPNPHKDCYQNDPLKDAISDDVSPRYDMQVACRHRTAKDGYVFILHPAAREDVELTYLGYQRAWWYKALESGM